MSYFLITMKIPSKSKTQYLTKEGWETISKSEIKIKIEGMGRGECVRKAIFFFAGNIRITGAEKSKEQFATAVDILLKAFTLPDYNGMRTHKPLKMTMQFFPDDNRDIDIYVYGELK